MYYAMDNSDKMSKFPLETPLAICYVPFQEFKEVYPENTALENGTIFPDLNFPFEGTEAKKNGR